MLDKCVSMCASYGPKEASPETLAYQGLHWCVVTPHACMYFSEELFTVFFIYVPLEDSISTASIHFSLMNLVGLGLPKYSSCLYLVIRELLAENLGQERLDPWCGYSRYFMS